MNVTEVHNQEMGALLVKHWRNDDVRCTVLLLARLPADEQRNSSGIYYRALLTWDDGRFEYDPAFLLAPFTSGWSTVVDPRTLALSAESR